MIGVKLESFINERYGKTVPDRDKAAADLGTKTSTLYRWMASGDFFVYHEGCSSVVFKFDKKAEILNEMV